MSAPIDVLVVDDHKVVRAGLVALLQQQPNLRVVGEAGTGEEALQCLERLSPDVVLMDLQMPVMGGVEATREIRRRWPKVAVLILTTYDDDELIWQGIQAGARGYLLKDAQPEELLSGVRTVASGGTLLPPEIVLKLTQVIQQGGSAETQGRDPLTEREQAILNLIAKGLSNKEIASHLFISENTVKTHISNLFQKLEVSDRTQAVTKAIRLGLIAL